MSDADLRQGLFVAGLILEAVLTRAAAIERENTFLRVTAQKVECPHGYRAESGACILGYPGCGCADDMMMMLDYMTGQPPTKHRVVIERLEQRQRGLEHRLLNARERIKIASRHFRTMEAGFRSERAPSKAAAVSAMADLMEAPL